MFFLSLRSNILQLPRLLKTSLRKRVGLAWVDHLAAADSCCFYPFPKLTSSSHAKPYNCRLLGRVLPEIKFLSFLLSLRKET